MEYNIELFISELQMDITEHELVPKHEKLLKMFL
jgi:DNA-directed RNA polymerase subunit H (RpoH/RPB5)